MKNMRFSKLIKVTAIVSTFAFLVGCGKTPVTVTPDAPVNNVVNPDGQIDTPIVDEPVMTAEEDVPDGLIPFLRNMEWIGTYDCNDYASVESLLRMMLGSPYSACDFSIYSNVITVAAPDQIYQFATENNTLCFEASGIDWLLTNIYCTNSDVIDQLRANYENSDGQYEVEIGGIGGGFDVQILDVKKEGSLYTVEYQVASDYEPENYVSKYALMEYKTIDGVGYWAVREINFLG